MDASRLGSHGHARHRLLPTTTPDSTSEERRWDVESAAFILFGSAPWRSFYEEGYWHIAFVRRKDFEEWFVATFGDTDIAIFRAMNAQGADTFEGVGFERLK